MRGPPKSVHVCNHVDARTQRVSLAHFCKIQVQDQTLKYILLACSRFINLL